jgi:hypothetical protein
MADSKGNNFGGAIGGGLAQVFGPSKANTEFIKQKNAKSDQLYGEINEVKAQAKEAKTFDTPLEGFDKDTNGQLLEEKEKIRAATRELFIEKGVNDDTLTQVQEMKQELRRKIQMSTGQKEVYKAASKKLQNQTAGKYFNLEESTANQEEFASLSIAERAEYNKPLLIRKEDQFSPINDMPSYFWSANFRDDPARFKDNIIRSITDSPEGQEWYQQGIIDKRWANPDGAVNYVREQHESKYKKASGRAPSKKNDHGDPSDLEDAKALQRESGTLTIGDQTFQTNGDVEFTSSNPESYGEITFIDLQGNERTENVNKFFPTRYFQNTSTGQSFLIGRREYVSITSPAEFSDFAAKKARLEYLGDGTISKDLTEEKQIEKTRELLSEDSKKTKKENIYIPITTDQQRKDQMKLRPHLWSTHTGSIEDIQFNEDPIEFNDWADNYKKEQEARSQKTDTIDGVIIDNKVINDLIKSSTEN